MDIKQRYEIRYDKEWMDYRVVDTNGISTPIVFRNKSLAECTAFIVAKTNNWYKG